MLFRLAYLGVTNSLALLRLLPMSDHDEDAEILALRHQVMVLERQLHGARVRFTPADRAWLAALLHPLPGDVLRHLRLLVRPETVVRWHLDPRRRVGPGLPGAGRGRMLTYQAAAGLKLITGHSPDAGRMLRHFEALTSGHPPLSAGPSALGVGRTNRRP